MQAKQELPVKCTGMPKHGRCLGAGDEGRVFLLDNGKTMKQMVLNKASLHEVRAHTAVYQGIRTKTPCVTPLFERWRCDERHMDPCSVAKNTKRRVKQGVVYAIMEKAKHGDLAQFIESFRSDPHFPEYMRSILFQILHALHVAQHEVKMTHWDLHTENILVTHTDETHRVVRIGGTEWRVPTHGFCPMLYDFGFAYVGKPPPGQPGPPGARRTPIERIWTRSVLKVLGVDPFRPFITGYDQTVLGAYLHFLLSEHTMRSSCANLRHLLKFLKKGISAAPIMKAALHHESLRPHGVTADELDRVTPGGALSHAFFQPYVVRATASATKGTTANVKKTKAKATVKATATVKKTKKTTPVKTKAQTTEKMHAKQKKRPMTTRERHRGHRYNLRSRTTRTKVPR